MTDAETIAALQAELAAAHKLIDKADQRTLIAHAERDHARRATAPEMARDIERLTLAGKHLAVKLAEVYRAAGHNPAECQAIRDWMEACRGVA